MIGIMTLISALSTGNTRLRVVLQKSAGEWQSGLVLADSALVESRTWDSNQSAPVRLKGEREGERKV